MTKDPSAMLLPLGPQTLRPPSDVAVGGTPVRWQAVRPFFQQQTGVGRERSSILHYLTLVFVFLYCSRLPEFIPQIRVLGLLQYSLIAMMMLTMRFGAILDIPGGKLMLAFSAWSLVCIPFSVWPGGTIEYVQIGLRTLCTLALLSAFISTTREALRGLYVLGLSMAFAASMSFVFGSISKNAGRLELTNSGTLGDPNYYCYYVLSGLPFLCLGVGLFSGLKRMVFLALIVPVMMVVGNTGSRMGVIALAAGLLFVLYVVPVKQKLALIAGSAALAILATVVLPAQIISRFTTIFASDDNTADAEMAINSTKSRQYLLQRGLEITAANPILGVGPGMFSIAEGADAATAGLKGSWHATHNTYVQIASEMGLPGALLYIFALFNSFKGLNRIRKGAQDIRIRRAVLFTQMSFVMVCISLMFLSIGYGGLPYVLIGLSGAFQVAFAKETMARNKAMAAGFAANS